MRVLATSRMLDAFLLMYRFFSPALDPCTPNPCKNGATCVSSPVPMCNCLNFFGGKQCEINMGNFFLTFLSGLIWYIIKNPNTILNKIKLNFSMILLCCLEKGVVSAKFTVKKKVSINSFRLIQRETLCGLKETLQFLWKRIIP